MRIGIVGSRTFPQLKLIEWFIRDLPGGVTIVSGGAVGADQAAEEYASRRGLPVTIHRPNLDGCSQRFEYTERYYERNQAIVNDSDLIVAFTEKDRGGTWDTIKRAHKAGKPVKIIRPSTIFPGEAEAEGEPGEEEIPEAETSKGKGPFQIRRASLGSYALRRKCYIDGEEWAGIVADKESAPEKLADKITPAMLDFFRNNNRLGIVHAVTVPPRSKRNLGQSHPMDIVAERISTELACEWVRMFEPWEKSTRGRFAVPGEVKILPDVKRFIGKVIWVLDDIYTTGRTMRSAVQALIALEIHAHGLAYVYMA